MECRRIIAEALELELNDFLDSYRGLKGADGKQRVVRNGYLPERDLQTGIGGVTVRTPHPDRYRTANRAIRFRSSILPPYLRKTRSIEELLPWLYLKGISTGDFKEALAVLVGENAAGLSANTIGRLKTKWETEFQQWKRRDLSGKRYVYWWVDGIYSNVRMAERQCLLVIIGITETGKKELVAIEDGLRESELSWKGVLRDLQSQGLSVGPELAIGDGSLGFWKALAELYPQTQRQRCWVHKTANVLNSLPKSLQTKAKQQVQAIWMAPDIKEAEQQFDRFIETYEAKYTKGNLLLSERP